MTRLLLGCKFPCLCVMDSMKIFLTGSVNKSNLCAVYLLESMVFYVEKKSIRNMYCDINYSFIYSTEYVSKYEYKQ